MQHIVRRTRRERVPDSGVMPESQNMGYYGLFPTIEKANEWCAKDRSNLAKAGYSDIGMDYLKLELGEWVWEWSVLPLDMRGITHYRPSSSPSMMTHIMGVIENGDLILQNKEGYRYGVIYDESAQYAEHMVQLLTGRTKNDIVRRPFMHIMNESLRRLLETPVCNNPELMQMAVDVTSQAFAEDATDVRISERVLELRRKHLLDLLEKSKEANKIIATRSLNGYTHVLSPVLNALRAYWAS